MPLSSLPGRKNRQFRRTFGTRRPVNDSSLSSTWGGITGTLSAQGDLQSALDLKLNISGYTAADVLAKILTVDGSGSTLDADTLDAHDTSYFLSRANHTGTQVSTTVTGLGAAAYSNVLTDLVGGAYSTTTPTPTPNSGSFTTATANIRYQQVGKTVYFSLYLTITTRGTAPAEGAAGYVDVALPFSSLGTGFTQSFGGREVGVTGKTVGATLLNNSTTLRIQRYDGTAMHGDGYILNINGTYEAA